MCELDDLLAEFVPLRMRMSTPFPLEDAAAQLSVEFDNVMLAHFAYGLRVTGAEPLMAYIGSMTVLTPKQSPQVEDRIRGRLNEEGADWILKVAGLVLAT